MSAHAYGGGISSGVLGPSGCNTCHTGGTSPVVSLTGPTTVTAGTTNEYLLIITSPPGQLSGGLSASSLLGDMLVGGSESALTQVTASGSGNNDVTHLSAKAGDGTDVRFSFFWEAPGSAGPATIDAWGNAVDGTGSPTGDASTFASLAITVEAGASPLVPATSPWSQAGMIALLLGAGSLFVLRRRSSLF
ncbi:MAG: hypothetical protein P8R42_07710 [Candidatus Binatia bacterium]|nr:hypothetical protein [Candidatus Binatia bacterium]